MRGVIVALLLCVGCDDGQSDADAGLTDAGQGCGIETRSDAGCDLLYEATYDQIFERTLSRSCSPAEANCHGSMRAEGGLILSIRDQAYSTLLEKYIVPGSPDCSELMMHLEARENRMIMPPGLFLFPEERCSIATWIQNGAQP